MYKLLLLSMILFLGFAEAFAAEASGLGSGEEAELRLAVSNHSKELTRGRELTESFFDSEFVAGFVLGSGLSTIIKLKSIAEKTGKPGAFSAAEQLAFTQSAVEMGQAGSADLAQANQKFSAFFSPGQAQ